MRRDLARWLAVCLLGFSIALGSAPQPHVGIPLLHLQSDPGNGSGGGG